MQRAGIVGVAAGATGGGMITNIHAELLRVQVDISGALLWLLCAPFYALGWLVGFLVRCVLWMVAALVAGYKAGRV